MFFSKKKELVPYNCFENKVKCQTCKAWLDKEDAQEVNVVVNWNLQLEYSNEYYCPIHKKKYEKKNYDPYTECTKYYKQVEVDEKGNVIKQK